MKKLSFYFVAVLSAILFFLNSAIAQKVSLKSGDLKFLKDITQVYVKYDYSNMEVAGNYIKKYSEEEFIKEKVVELNNIDAGKGDLWKEGWLNAKESTFQRKFALGLNYQFERKGINIKIGDYKEAKYTLILHTTRTIPGYNAGIGKPTANIYADAIFIETGKPENELAIVEIKRSSYRGSRIGDNTAVYRVGQTYAIAGKALARFIWKKYLK